MKLKLIVTFVFEKKKKTIKVKKKIHPRLHRGKTPGVFS